MKILKKTKFQKGNTLVKKYKFCGLSVLRKEKSPTKKKWKILNILTICRKRNVLKKFKFPLSAKSCCYEKKHTLTNISRVAVFASFSSNGKIADYVIYYLKELRKVCDAIIFIADNPINPDEIKKIENLVVYAQFKRHNEYDFGSYKRGYFYAKQHGLLKNCKQLIICNDSVYGPIYPLSDIFAEMENKAVDFWGLISNIDIKFHLQSWFYVFNHKIIKSGDIERFLKKVTNEASFWDVVLKYEMDFTNFLIKKGYTCASYLPPKVPEIQTSLIRAGHNNPTVFPLTLVSKYHLPFIKVKCFTGGFSSLLEETPMQVLDFLEQQNNDLYLIITCDIKDKGAYNHLLMQDIDYMIKDSDVVSFDIFDTLLIRPYLNPTDCFEHMEKYYNIPNFAKHRVNAELRARKLNPQKEDITLDDIYTQILPEYQSYKEKELFFEEHILSAHPLNYALYMKALAQHKRIIITSDMYLPTKFIEKILHKNGYTNIEKIYVSGDLNLTKCSGTLFQKILSDLNITPDRLLHIGDNEYSDINIPNKLGIKTYHVQKYMDYFAQFDGNRKYNNFYKENPCLERSIIISQIAKHQLTNGLSYWEDIGYSLGGPLSLGYVQMIIEEVKRNNIDCLLFVSRDGYLLQKVYHILEKKTIENHYIYAPRILDLKCFGDYKNNPAYLKTLVNILKEQLHKKGRYDTQEKRLQFLETYRGEISEYYKKNKSEYDDYLRSLNIKGEKIASVDMTTGAFSSERFLSKFLKNRYCFAFFSATFTNDIALKYLTYMNTLINPNKQEGLMMLMELLITAPELPIEDIKNKRPVYKKENIYDLQRVNISKQIEIGICNFINDYISTFSFLDNGNLPKISMDTNLSLLNNYTHNMSNVDIAALKQVYHATDIANENFSSLYDELIKRN